MSKRTTWVVIPCFNEVDRLNRDGVLELIANDEIGVVLVDDGSSDGTRELIFDIQSAADGIEALILQQNVGKAEAVRRGLNHSLTFSAEVVGYLDADFATSASDMLSLLQELRNRNVKVCLGSRWLHLGARIDRSTFRHYGGRVFATIASSVLNLSVYDTQCGAKVFRVNDVLEAAISEPFLSRWAFDVELIGRLLKGQRVDSRYTALDFVEVPLQTWRDIKGAKITFIDMVTATFELLLIRRALRLWSRSS